MCVGSSTVSRLYRNQKIFYVATGHWLVLVEISFKSLFTFTHVDDHNNNTNRKVVKSLNEKPYVRPIVNMNV